MTPSSGVDDLSRAQLAGTAGMSDTNIGYLWPFVGSIDYCTDMCGVCPITTDNTDELFDVMSA